MNSSSPSDVGSSSDLASLVRSMARGEQPAMQEFYDQTKQLVYSLVLRIVRDHHLAEDVSIEVYAQIWRDAATYDTTRGTPCAWLLMVARSRAIDCMRSRRHETKNEPMDQAGQVASDRPTPEHTTAVAERGVFVRGALSHLNDEQREAIELAFFGGMSHSEIADRLDQPLGTIKTRIRTGMLKLRDLLEHLESPSLTSVEGRQ